MMLVDDLSREGEDEIILHGARVAAAMERENEYRAGNLRGDDATGLFLSRFRDHVLPGLRWKKAVWYANRARSIARDDLRALIPERLIEHWRCERATDARDIHQRVYLSTGTPYGKDTRYREGKRRERILDPYEKEAPNRVARMVYRLMRSLPSQQITRLVKADSYGKALRVAESLNPEARAFALATLHQLAVHPWQNYGFSAHSPRVWGQGLHLAQVHTSVRRAFLSDSIELDLSSAQLAIAARDWRLPKLTDFLGRGGSIWSELIRFTGLPNSSASKKALKEGTYGLLYGAGERRVSDDIQSTYMALTGVKLPAEKASRVIGHPFLQEALKRRNELLDSIREQGGAPNCFGQWVSEGKSYGGDCSRSVLAQVAQARELWLLEPLIEACLDEAQCANSRFWVTLWQHDGMSLRVSQNKTPNCHVEMLSELVNSRAMKFQYHTTIEIKH